MESIDRNIMTLDLSKVGRETALRTWMAYHCIDQGDVARQLGVQPSTLSRIICGERATRHIIEALVEQGFPRQLLPEPGPAPGRPPKERTR